ncbi:TIGR02302 family protein [Roseovarius sp.]|uniref:TIGR02302 family protein n=1 Tax=Roseovarius sp. TaxID=1486281 RepID=UPI003BAD4CBF
MARQTPLTPVMNRLRRPLSLTWAGLIAERLVRAFWPFWTVLAATAAALILGLQDLLPVEVVWVGFVLAGLGLIGFAIHGAMRFRWPRRQEAVDRMDSVMPGRPLAALGDRQAIGGGDPASEALWQAHLRRMAERASAARAVEPDLALAPRDPFGLRYVALLGLVVALLFGSVMRVGSVSQMGPGSGPDIATGPAWEGWIEPPTYTGLPSLYLNDQKGEIRVPEGSRVTVRLYGEVGALSVAETVSGRTEDVGAATDTEHSFVIVSDGTLSIDGPGGKTWTIVAIPDREPQVSLVSEGAKTTFDGQMSQPFKAEDDHGVVAGKAIFRLDLDAVERRYGLATEPEPREPISIDLPMPITGDRAEFTETLIENLSQHPWAHLPVTLELEVSDAAEQAGQSAPEEMKLPARRFFDPLAASVIEMRRDLLWSRDNARRVAQVLRAVSHAPEEGLFRSETAYLRLRVILRRLETLTAHDSLTTEARDEVAQALWDLALVLEDGDIGDALERMREAQERLSEAMRNGASEDEIARLMQELRDATQDYLRQKSQQAQRDREQQQGDQQLSENMMMLNQQDLQDMMDRIQELMEEGRYAEAEQALQEFQEMMENLRITEGQQGQQGDNPGQEAMEGLAETLRDQQGLSDQAFRDLQEQFNPNSQQGQSQQNEGRDGSQGRGQSHQQGQGDQQGQGNQPGQQQGQNGQQGQQGTLADRQEALRRELERQRGNLPGAGSEAGEAARESLDRADQAMRGAEDALRQDDLAEAIDRQSEAMEALREGMRNLGEAMAENNQTQGAQGQARGQFGDQQNDPLGRAPGQGSQVGTQDNLLQGEDVYRRARELLDEIRRRSGEGERPDVELEYLKRLLERF